MKDSEWEYHDGRGRPIPLGSVVDVRRFNGDVERIIAGAGPTVAPNGVIMDPSCARWNAWDHFDGGPMAVKFRAYRIVKGAHSPEHKVTRQTPSIEAAFCGDASMSNWRILPRDFLALGSPLLVESVGA